MASLRPRKRTKGKPSGLFAFPRTAASFAPLTPVAFLPRIAAIHPDGIAVVHGAQRISYRQFEERARRLASALARRGIRPGQTVSAMLANVPDLVGARFGVHRIGV